jgi:hypothetical protein
MPKPTKLDRLLAIGATLAPRAKTLAKNVSLATRDPALYLKRHAARARGRGIHGPIPNLAWIALIDELIDAEACAEIDWKEGRPEVFAAIRGLPGCPKGAVVWAKEDKELESRGTWELLELTGRALAQAPVRLAQLDMQSDNYCLVLVPADHAATLAAHAQAAGFGKLQFFTGEGLAAATKDRVARQERINAFERGKDLPWESLPEPGAVYVFPLDDGGFGACRVLRRSTDEETAKWGRCLIVANTPWFGTALPSIDDPRLRQILVLTHHSFKAEPHVKWIDEVPPASFQRLGSVPPTAEESRIEVQRFRQQRAIPWRFMPMQRSLQLSWDDDRERAPAKPAKRKAGRRERR